jgi:Arm DNA-binding domain
MHKKLTDKTVKSLEPTGKQVDYFDSLTPGFGIRVNPSGVKSWVYMYRLGGKLRRLKLGRYPDRRPATRLATSVTR